MSRETVLRIAEKENGVVEDYKNKTKYGKWFGQDGEPWCAMFVSWVFYEAGVPLPNINGKYGYSSCQDGYYYWKKYNHIVNKPQPGDIVLYDLNEGGKISDHTGIFVEWIKFEKTFYAWEGNTSRKGDRDGGHVMLQTRTFKEVKAFVDPGVF